MVIVNWGILGNGEDLKGYLLLIGLYGLIVCIGVERLIVVCLEWELLKGLFVFWNVGVYVFGFVLWFDLDGESIFFILVLGLWIFWFVNLNFKGYVRLLNVEGDCWVVWLNFEGGVVWYVDIVLWEWKLVVGDVVELVFLGVW